jgi:hypothetical protein
MIATLLAVLSIGVTPQTLSLSPTDDIWVYPHASDPEKDGYLRCWGAEGQAVAPDPDEGEEFSYSYLKFDLGKLPKSFQLKSAKLVLWHVADPGWDISVSKENPVQVRGVGAAFAEKNWEYDISKTLYPEKTKEAVFGSLSSPKPEAGKPIMFEVDLMKGPGDFAKFLKVAAEKPDRMLGVALTSTINPSEFGQKSVYKFYSKDWEKADLRPALKLLAE